jgi:hypothetical protein
MSLFIERARKEGNNSSLLYVLGCVISFIGGQIIGAIPLLVAMVSKGAITADISTLSHTLGLSNNVILVLMLLPFVVSFILLWLHIRFVHKKRFVYSITAFHRIDWGKILFAFFLWLTLNAISDVVYYIKDPTIYEFNFKGFFVLDIVIDQYHFDSHSDDV